MTKIRLAAVALVCALAALGTAPASAELPPFATVDHELAPAPDIGQDAGAIAPDVDDATVLALGRVIVSEANWAQTPDAAAIAEVLRGRQLARGDVRLLDTIRAYCPRATGVRPSTLIRMAWISTLRLDAGEPAGWRDLNEHRAGRGLLPLRWSTYEPRWRGRLAEARELLERPVDACPGTVDHWGARSLDRTGLGWTEIRCGDPAGPETINRFWRLPARIDPRASGARSGPISRG